MRYKIFSQHFEGGYNIFLLNKGRHNNPQATDSKDTPVGIYYYPEVMGGLLNNAPLRGGGVIIIKGCPHANSTQILYLT